MGLIEIKKKTKKKKGKLKSGSQFLWKSGSAIPNKKYIVFLSLFLLKQWVFLKVGESKGPQTFIALSPSITIILFLWVMILSNQTSRTSQLLIGIKIIYFYYILYMERSSKLRKSLYVFKIKFYRHIDLSFESLLLEPLKLDMDLKILKFFSSFFFKLNMSLLNL